MNWKFLALVLSLGLVSSCNKFEHETFTVPSCELCDYAETLEGTYRGLSSGIFAPNYSDSMTLFVEQIFLGNSQYEDSTYLHFKVYWNFDSSSDTRIEMIRTNNTSGDFKNGRYNISPDSIVLNYVDWTGPSSMATFLDGTFYRQ